MRGCLPDIGDPEVRSGDVPLDEDLELCIKAMQNSKKCGLDEVAIELYKASPTAKHHLF